VGSVDVVCAGILVADLFLPPLSRLPDEGELLKVDTMLLDTGGCAANTATDLTRLGVRAGVQGMVGADALGDFIRADLGRKGLADLSGIRSDPSTATSQTVILPVRGQDRRYIHALGANARFSLQEIDPAAVGRARVLYIGGYGVLPGLDPSSLAQLFAYAREKGVITVLDVAGVEPQGGRAGMQEILPQTDVVLPNNDEAAVLTGLPDPQAQARQLLAMGAGTVVITQGARGALAATRDGRMLRAAAYPVELVDGSGCGDAFDAGFILGLLEGWDLRRTVLFASAVGASCCTRLGCTAGVFTRQQAEAFVASRAVGVFDFDQGSG
jgi:sugar/nucleoside kinase (ribokinase family)